MIGKDGALPWHLPADMAHFKRLTTGHTVIMGRKTFETLDRPLPNRRNVVVTRNLTYRPHGVDVVQTLRDALDLVRGEDEVFVVGGSEIYRLALPFADRLYLTIVHGEFEGDTFFPPIDLSEWVLQHDARHEPDERHAYPFTFRVYERRTKKPAPPDVGGAGSLWR